MEGGQHGHAHVPLLKHHASERVLALPQGIDQCFVLHESYQPHITRTSGTEKPAHDRQRLDPAISTTQGMTQAVTHVHCEGSSEDKAVPSVHVPGPVSVGHSRRWLR